MEIVFAPYFQLIDLEKAAVGYFGDAETALDVYDTGRFHARLPDPAGRPAAHQPHRSCHDAAAGEIDPIR
jgi:hypothetical protein